MYVSCFEVDDSDIYQESVTNILDELGVKYLVQSTQVLSNHPKITRYWLIMDDEDYIVLADYYRSINRPMRWLNVM